MNALAVVPPDNLDGLASLANREHGLALEAGLSMVEHAISAGEALLAAKEQCEPGTWLAWREANFGASKWTAEAYMKIAANKDLLTDLGERPTLVGTLKYLRAFPEADRSNRADEALRAEAVRRFDGGETNRSAIARALGVSDQAVRDWTDEEYASRRRRAQRERNAESRPVSPSEGPQQLAMRVRAVSRARREDLPTLRTALVDLAATATAWADSISGEIE